MKPHVTAGIVSTGPAVVCRIVVAMPYVQSQATIVPGADDVLPLKVHSSAAPPLMIEQVSVSVRPLTPNRAVAPGACVTERTSDTDAPPYEPLRVPVVVTPTVWVVMANVAVVAPAATTTLAGTVSGSLPDSTTVAPPVGAVLLSVTVPVIGLPPTTLNELEVIDEMVTAAGAGVTEAGVTVGDVLEPLHAASVTAVRIETTPVIFRNMTRW